MYVCNGTSHLKWLDEGAIMFKKEKKCQALTVLTKVFVEWHVLYSWRHLSLLCASLSLYMYVCQSFNAGIFFLI